MARAEVDLDDPVRGGDGAASNSADDLLAQLAGDEVDRMLSEADAAAPEPLNVDRAVPDPAGVSTNAASANLATSNPAPAAGSAADDSVLEATEAALDGLFDELNASAPQFTPAPEANQAQLSTPPLAKPVVAAKSAPLDSQSIEEVITQRAQDLIAQARLETEEDSAPAAASIASGEPLSAADALAAEMEADESCADMAALKRMKSGAAEAAEESPVSAQTEEPAKASFNIAPADAGPTQIDEDKVDFSPAEKADRVPLLVRVLEWINAPLDGLSDGVRAAIGKVAIVTMLNAIGVFLYVVMFRRH